MFQDSSCTCSCCESLKRKRRITMRRTSVSSAAMILLVISLLLVEPDCANRVGRRVLGGRSISTPPTPQLNHRINERNPGPLPREEASPPPPPQSESIPQPTPVDLIPPPGPSF